MESRYEKIFKIIQTIGLLMLFIIPILFASITSSNAESNIPNATGSFYVNDFADVLSIEQALEMNERAYALDKDSDGVQVVVTTVKYLDGMSVEKYANLMYDQYAIGKDSKGILILLATEDREIRVEVGDGLKYDITNYKAGEYIDNYALKFLKNNQFDIGLMALQKAIVEDLYAKYKKPKMFEEPDDSVVSEVLVVSNPIETTQPESSIATVPSRSISNTQSNTTISTNKNADSNNGYLVPILTLIGAIIGFFVGAIIQSMKKNSLVKKHETEIEDYEAKLNDRDVYIDSLRINNSQLNDSIEEQKASYNTLKQNHDYLVERYSRARKLHPNLEQEIEEMIKQEIDAENRRIAAEFDKEHSELETSAPLEECMKKGYEGYLSFERLYLSAFSAYDNLNSEQKGYVKTDINNIRKRYDEGMAQKSREDAQKYNEELKDAIDHHSATESNLSLFNQLYTQYNNLDARTRELVNVQLFHVLGDLKNRAEHIRAERIRREEEEERKRRQREEERRRRQREEEARRRRSSSSSSYSSHRGHGGHSSGNGASRRF